MSQTRFCVVTPKGWQHPDWGYVYGRESAISYCNGAEGRPLIAFMEQLSGHYIEDERNIRTHQFLLSDATHLAFIDSDICWHVDNLLALLETGKDVISATHRQKDGSGSIAGLGVLGQDGKLVRCKAVAGGFLLLTRRAVKLACAHRDVQRYSVEGVGLVETVWNEISRPGELVYARDDFAFSMRASEMGLDLWRHTEVVVGHAGRAVY